MAGYAFEVRVGGEIHLVIPLACGLCGVRFNRRHPRAEAVEIIRSRRLVECDDCGTRTAGVGWL